MEKLIKYRMTKKRTKIIAELCQNHNGDRELLSKMIKAATDAGADYIKGQIIYSEDTTHRERFDEGAIEEHGIVKSIKRPYKAEVERLSKLDLTEDDHKWFVEEVKKYGAIPITTVFTRSRIPFSSSLPWSERTVKIASPDCTSYPFISELCEHFDHLVISTGGATDEEIEKAAKVVKDKGKELTLLHCVSIYPNALAICNLSRMEYLKKYSTKVGWSDHTHVPTDGIKAAKVAVYLGADIIERHFTILSPEESKDGPVSITPELLAELVEFTKLSKDEQKAVIDKEVPNWAELMGNPKRILTHTEVLTMDYMRGRFASKKTDGSFVYNWEDKPLK